MRNRALPSLDLVIGFESAARHLSFTKAAGELFITQSAVSRQVKALEDHLGVLLFTRHHRALALTPAGQDFYRAAADAIGRLNAAAQRVSERSATRVLTVSTTIGFASLWLIPRLPDFLSAHPGIDIRISANNRILDLERERIELAIRYCPPSMAPQGAVKLFGEQVLPVCSPALLKRRPLAQPADLRRHVLLHYERPDGPAPWLTWKVWLETVQLADLRPAGALHFTQFDQVVQAAIDGQGVAIATTPLVRDFIRQRRLAAPLGGGMASSHAYYVVSGPGAAERAEVKAFVGWLVRQARKEKARAGLAF